MSLQRTWPFAMMGVILSSYALYVEHKMAHKPDEEEFVALCDIDAIGASCR
jgi:preprotein translocase subunit Sss1